VRFRRDEVLTAASDLSAHGMGLRTAFHAEWGQLAPARALSLPNGLFAHGICRGVGRAWRNRNWREYKTR
jgi:hypothetical protein